MILDEHLNIGIEYEGECSYGIYQFVIEIKGARFWLWSNFVFNEHMDMFIYYKWENEGWKNLEIWEGNGIGSTSILI